MVCVNDRGTVMTRSTMAGGGSLLRNLDKRIAHEVGIITQVVADPLSVVVIGSGVVLDKLEDLRDVVLL